MNKKTLSVIMSIALVAIGIGVTLSAEQNMSTSSSSWTPTDPSQFTNVNYVEKGHASYTITNPFEIRDDSQNVIIGKVVNVDHTSFGDQSKFGNDEFGEPIEPKFDYTTYTVVVKNQIKGKYMNDQIIQIKSIIPSKIGFEQGDTMFVMFSETEGELMPYAGPHGFFKIVDDKAVGHEKTLLLDSLLN